MRKERGSFRVPKAVHTLLRTYDEEPALRSVDARIQLANGGNGRPIGYDLMPGQLKTSDEPLDKFEFPR